MKGGKRHLEHGRNKLSLRYKNPEGGFLYPAEKSFRCKGNQPVAHTQGGIIRAVHQLSPNFGAMIQKMNS